MDKALLARHILGKSGESKQRLQFPVTSQQKKHFQAIRGDQIRLGQIESAFSELKRFNKLDISGIEGARPRNGHAKRNQRLHTLEPEPTTRQIADSLDQLSRKSFQKRNFSLKQLRNSTELSRPVSKQNKGGSCSKPEEKVRVTFEHLKTQPAGISNLDKYRIVDPEQRYQKFEGKRSILQNPTYISSLFL